MVIQISFEEINSLIRKTGKPLGISYKDTNTFTVTYLATVNLPMLGEKTKSFSVDVRIVSVSSPRIYLSLDTRAMATFALDKAKSYILSKTPQGLIERFDGRDIILNLAALPQARSVLDMADVNNLIAAQGMLYIEASLKTA